MKKFIGAILSLMCLIFIGTQEAQASKTSLYHDHYAICDDVGGDHAVCAIEQATPFIPHPTAGIYVLATMRCCKIYRYDGVSHSCMAKDIWLQENRITLDSPVTAIRAKKRCYVPWTCDSTVSGYLPPWADNRHSNRKV